MKLSELVEAKAREAANSVYTEYADDLTISSDDWGPDYIEKHIQSAIIATLNECGFGEALEWIANNGDSSWAESICSCYEKYATEEKHDADCTCPCHTVSEKLKELEELSK